MVISATVPQVVSDVFSVQQVENRPEAPAPPGKSGHCPRCSAILLMGYDEPQCLSCGFSDYSYSKPTSLSDRSNIISAATRFVLRYAGDFPKLGETLTHVKTVRVRNKAVFAVTCPFCEKSMDQSSLSGKRPDVREQRYKCMDGHRVSLVPGNHGMMGWR